MHFTLRQKIFLHFFIFMAITSIVWLLIYFNYNTMDKKLRLIEKKNDLFNIVLEARRYEKNFFLRNNRKDLEQAVSFVEKALLMQKDIAVDFSEHIQEPSVLSDRIKEIQIYKKKMISLIDVYDNSKERHDKEAYKQAVLAFQSEIAALGRRITLETERIENIEKEKLYKLLNRSKKYFIISLVGFFLLSIITAFFLAFNVNRPLKIIENSIKKILNGDFSKIPKINTSDEFESLTISLNNMIDELNKRNEQLFQAEKMSSLGTLTSGVAHELNNPLNNISTSVQIVLEEFNEPGNESIRDLLAETDNQVDRARDIVRSLLEFSRQSEFSVKQHNFKKLVEDTLMLIKGDIPSNIDVKLDIYGDIFGRFDFNRVQQVLLNLIINATHAMKNGGTLNIVAYKEKDESIFSFKVMDTGSGIPPEHINRIFDPFFTTKEVGKGSGLGLSIIHGIIEQHNGKITVDSKEGQGTVFTVTLPV